MTPFHSRYWATLLTLRDPTGSVESLSRSIANARLDLNPHQVDAALFALRSPLSKGVVLADEVGLGKTIEAGLVIAQRWAERHRRVLVIVPATLRTQWQQELREKFFLESIALDSRSYNAARRQALALSARATRCVRGEHDPRRSRRPLHDAGVRQAGSPRVLVRARHLRPFRSARIDSPHPQRPTTAVRSHSGA